MEQVSTGARGSQEKIFVSVRVRPLNGNEVLNNDCSDWECINYNTIIYKNNNAPITERSSYPAAYTFDGVFGEDCSTREVYEQGAKEVALSVLNGINSTVFAYGQTSSGKTYTMTGVTGYAVEDIYEYIQKHAERKFIFKFSAMEIYNESVRDLLSTDATPLRLLDDPERGTIVDKLVEETIRDQNHLLQLVSICAEQRQTGETYLNENSSRSHQIIRLTVESSARELLGKDKFTTLTGTLNFVDLAGSERASQALTAGSRLKEGGYINRSLLTLSTVIRKLSHGRNEHIPYRDSKLTRILQTSLGGNAKTAIICTISPARTHVEQSRNTLLFATRAKEVTINAHVNVVMSDKTLVKHLQREVARLESELRTPGSTSASLRQKDLQIEKLEKEVKDLILQRDIVQSQLKEVLQLLGDDTDSVQQLDVGNNPNLQVRVSSEPVSNQVTELRDSPEIRRTSANRFTQVPNFKEIFQHVNTSPRRVVGSSNYSETDSVGGFDELEIRSNGISEDLSKEAHTFEKEDHNSKKPVIPEEHISHSRLKGSVGDTKENQISLLSMTNRDYEVRSPRLVVGSSNYSETDGVGGFDELEIRRNGISEDLSKEAHTFEKEDHNSKKPVIPEEHISHSRLKGSVGDTKENQRSIVSMTNRDYELRSPEVNVDRDESENVEKEADLVSTIYEIQDNLTREQSPSIFNPDLEMLSARKGTNSPSRSIENTNIENFDNKSSVNEDIGDNDSSKLMKEKPELQIIEEVAKDLGKTDSKEAKRSVQSSKDARLNHIEDKYRSLQSWPAEFKMLQKEIIDLWQLCHESLLHRTYFFLLFQGEPADAVYMAVELRRMLFLKEKFAKGEKTVIRGKKMSLGLNKKVVRQERRMLSLVMLKKLSDEERDMLFLKWGIGVASKLRRLQLANRMWSNTQDMNHIRDSAHLVAKLIGFVERDQAPKEMFSLDFSPQRST